MISTPLPTAFLTLVTVLPPLPIAKPISPFLTTKVTLELSSSRMQSLTIAPVMLSKRAMKRISFALNLIATKTYPIFSKIVESPGSFMIKVATVNGLPQTEPKSTLVPSYTMKGISERFA